MNPLRELPTACKRPRLNRIRSPEGPQKVLSPGWWKDPYFQWFCIFSIRICSFFIFKGVVICNVVQMRPRTRVRIQNPAVPAPPPALSPQHTRAQVHAHRMHSSPWPAVAPTQPWLPDARPVREGGLGGRVRGFGRAHPRSGPQPPANPAARARPSARAGVGRLGTPGVERCSLAPCSVGWGTR